MWSPRLHISILGCKIISAGLMCVMKPHFTSSTFSLCAPHSRRRWSGWSRAPTPAARRRSSVRLSSTAHGCSPASCPTSSRTLTGEASSGPRCLELEGPRYDSGTRIPRGGQFISCLFTLLGIALKRHRFEVIMLCSGSGL